jgi:acylphosphatase
MKAARFIVSGKVQGVCFRASTREQAQRLQLAGYAKNLPDGRVEVLAVGKEDALADLERWLWQGPPLAKVEEVSRQEEELPALVRGFDTL